MSYQVLARKWRPRNFEELVGQEHVQRALVNALDNDRLHHAYLFTGTRGVGKTTIARILAKSLNCETGVTSHPCGECSACREINEGRFIDLVEVDAASRTKVEDTRELLENVQYAPTRGRYKVYLIDEVHMLSGHSFNALLKTLEEPPPHVKFLLATTDPQKLPVTVLSRCLQFNLKSLTLAQIGSQLEMVLAHEHIETDAGAIRQLALAANGSMRDALSLLDQAIAYCNGRPGEAEVRSMLGTIDRDVIYRLLDALAAGDAAALLAEVAAADAFAPDYAALLADLVSLLQRIAVAQALPDAIDDNLGDRDAILRLATTLTAEDVQLFYQIGLIGRRDLPLAPEPRGGLEMVLLRMLAFRPESAARPAAAAGQPAAATPRNRPPGSVARPAPAAPSAAPEPAPAVTTAATAVDDDWPAMIDCLPLKGMVREMALNCAFHGIEGETVRLSMEHAHAHLLNPARLKQLESALCAHLGRSLRVNVVREEQLAAESPAQRQQREQQERQRRAVDSIAGDATIKAMQDTFGATVFEDSIRPRD
jgi:DNA polymerase-3 subunit gamma/tau